MDPVVHQLCRDAIGRLAVASSHEEKTAIVAELARVLPGRNGGGASVTTAYRLLREAGWDSGRKERADKGTSKVSQEELEQTVLLVAKSRNRRGRNYMPLKVAKGAAERTGRLTSDVSYRHLCRLTRQAGLSNRAMNAPEFGISRQSQHPNHVFCIDVSVALHWFFRDEENGEILDFYSDADARFYANKIENFKKIKRIIHRYIGVDHYSGCYFVWYAYSAGENAIDMVNFIFALLSKKGEDGDLVEQYPFRGLPRRILADQGPGFKSGLVQSLCKDLDIKVEMHVPGNAKANGGVETRHRRWSEQYESLMLAKGAHNLEELNRWAALCCAEFNATLPHSRHGKVPIEKWCEITGEQLVECPPRETFFRMAMSATKEASVDGWGQIHADSKVWELSGDRLYTGCKVKYRLSPFLQAGIRVWDENGTELAATPLEKDPISGFYTNGRRHVWDDETAPGATAPAPPAQKMAREVKKGKTEVSLEGIFDGLEQRVARHIYLTARGREWQPAGPPETAREERIGLAEIREEVGRRLDRPLTVAEGRWWRTRVGAGLTLSEMEEAWNEACAADFRYEKVVGG